MEESTAGGHRRLSVGLTYNESGNINLVSLGNIEDYLHAGNG